MKLIHIADAHLDSKMESNLEKERAKERRNELLQTFFRIVAYAGENEVRAILIAGDFFDTDVVSRAARTAVFGEIEANPEIDFYYLKGNHDVSGFFNKFASIPENLKSFETDWTYYGYEAKNGRKIVIAGAELTKEKKESLYGELHLREEDFNIVLLHGDLQEYPDREDAESIDKKALVNRNIDYLALGHIHEHRIGLLPPRGRYCYPGCPEGRGFDECGEHGFVLLSIDEERFEAEYHFLPFAKRRLFELSVDITGLLQVRDVLLRIKEEARERGVLEADYLKVILSGETEVETEKNWDLLQKELAELFYFVKIYDRTKTKIAYEAYLKDATLKGEFVRLLRDSEEEEKEEIIRCGLRALQGEEFEL